MLQTLRPAATFANRTADVNPEPSARETASAPVKQSPAPVVSTTEVTGMAGISSSPSGEQIRAPAEPIVTTTISTPRRRSSAAASAGVAPGEPISKAASVSFGVRIDTSASRDDGSGAPGAGFNS